MMIQYIRLSTTLNVIMAMLRVLTLSDAQCNSAPCTDTHSSCGTDWTAALCSALSIVSSNCPVLCGLCDTTDPELSCITSVTTNMDSPNIFQGLNNGTEYNATDNSGSVCVSYNTSTGHPPSGDLILPGETQVALTVTDSQENPAMCIFTVINTLTVLPVECPDFQDIIEVDSMIGTYTFIQPDYGHVNVTLIPDTTYYPHGGNYSVVFSIGDGQNLSVGDYELTTTISDTELHKDCSSTLTVRDTTPPLLECISRITTDPSTPNTFQSLNALLGEFNASDPSTPLDISYNPPTGIPSEGGTLFPPGDTNVTLSVSDSYGNVASCNFTVVNTLTKLPVECPNFNNTLEVDTTTGTYMFIQPDSRDINVTLRPNITYYPHGGTFSLVFAIDNGTHLQVGDYKLMTTISDTELYKNCSSTLTVRESEAGGNTLCVICWISGGIVLSIFGVTSIVCLIYIGYHYSTSKSRQHKNDIDTLGMRNINRGTSLDSSGDRRSLDEGHALNSRHHEIC